MPTLWSQSLIPTLREAPADATVPSHQLMLRAGLIRQLGAGMYSYLPLGLRALQKVMNIIRQEMTAAGAIEVLMPTLQPIELWERTGRRIAYGENLFVIEDRHGRELALGPTHEEVTTDLIKAFVDSYRQLPITVYQIQTKFRDEYRPRFGVLRSREFQMKDAYSFDITIDGLDRSYQLMYDAYIRIFERCGLPIEIVEAESGPIGGSASHEFMVPSPTGEDTILKSDKGNYAANVEKCETGPRAWTMDGDPTGELERVHTPECARIEDVCNYFKKHVGTKLKASNMLKTLVYQLGDAGSWVLAVVRGDHEVNESKLRAALKQQVPLANGELHLADEQAARKAGFAVGFVGPHVVQSREDVDLIIDPDAARAGFWVTGANEADYHVKHFHWNRDVIEYAAVQVADIRNAVAGDPSPKNDGGVLQDTKGIEIGHVFKLGCKYSDALELSVLDKDNQRKSVIMGCYGIGVNRILAAAIERKSGEKIGHDENGIIWPVSIAPYQVLITPIKYEAGSVAEQTARTLATALEAQGCDVLIDDRDERPGVKFKDADLVGIPVRITLGEKSLAEGKVEIKARDGRNGPKGELVAIDQAAARVIELLAGK